MPTINPRPAHRLYRLSLLLLAALAPFSAAQEARPGAGDDAAVLPFIDEGTFIVARLDVDRVDAEALGKYMVQSTERMLKAAPVPEEQLAQIKQQVRASAADAKTWLTDMSAAGGKRVYVLVDQADQQTPGGDGPVIVVPLAPGADAEKIKDALDGEGTGRMSVDRVGNAVVLGQVPSIDRVKKLADGSTKPAARPDLAKAFAAAGKDVPLRVAFVPGESTRKWIEENLPQLPPQLGGGDTKLLSRGVLYAGVGVGQKPGTIAHFTVRAADAEQAKALLDLLNKGARAVKEMAAQGPMGAEFAKEVDAFKPQAQGDTIRFSVDPMMVTPRMAVGTVQAGPPQPAPPPAQPAKPDDGGL